MQPFQRRENDKADWWDRNKGKVAAVLVFLALN